MEYLSFVVVDIKDTVPRSRTGALYINVATDQSSELSYAVRTLWTSATHASIILLKHCADRTGSLLAYYR